MEDLNRVALVGRLTRDPDIRGNNNVMAMRLAVTGRDKDPDTGEYGDVPNYFDVVLFGENRINALSSLIGKGSRIGIDGKLKWREFTDKQGNDRQGIEIMADNLFLLDNRKEKSDLPTGDAPAPKADDSDIPF